MRDDIKVSDQAKNDPVYRQIATDALAYGEAHCIVSPRHHVEFAAGAMHQDPIAWNRCLDVVRGLLTDWNAIIGFSPSDYKSMQEELEKLRR